MTRRAEVLKILIIEDNPGDFLLIEEYLQEEHDQIQTEWRKTFTETKELLKSETIFDAILLDLSLPDAKSSDHLVEEILKLAGNIPVIVLTGFTKKEYGIKTLSLGVSDYLLKDELTPSVLQKSIDYSIERKKVQLQLAESEKKYRTIFESSPMPMWVLDRYSLEFLSVNEAAVEVYGYSREEFLKMNVQDLWREETVEEAQRTARENLHDTFNIKVKHHTKDGKLLCMDVQSRPIIYAGKEARMSLVNDISARVQAEEQLVQSEQRFKSLVQEGSDLIAILDWNFRYQYVSPTSISILGVPPEEYLGKNAFDFIHPEDAPKVIAELDRLRNKKRIQIPSFRFKNSEGNWRWLETIVTDLSGDPGIGGVVANSRDITSFIEQEQKLIESVRRYDTVAKATSDLITDYDVRRDKMQYSDAIQEMFGYTEKEIRLTGDWWNDKIHPEDHETVKGKVNEMFNGGGKHLQMEYRFRCADGSYKYILDRSYLLTDENDDPVRIIGSMQDITERKNYVKAIECSNQRLKEIAWTQSHIVRAPLAKVMGLVDLLKNHRESLEDSEEILENILTSSEELDAIIRKIATKTGETGI